MKMVSQARNLEPCEQNPCRLNMFSCVTAGTIHDPAERCLQSAILDPAERRHNKTANMKQHGRYPRPHGMTSVCPSSYSEQNAQQNGIAWHLPSTFRAKQATPYLFCQGGQILVQKYTHYFRRHAEEVEECKPAGKTT